MTTFGCAGGVIASRTIAEVSSGAVMYVCSWLISKFMFPQQNDLHHAKNALAFFSADAIVGWIRFGARFTIL
jgi:hypothetical protein